MSGKRLLDLAAIVNASRGVAQKHFALRARQIDVYNRTSTLARAVQNQTERVTETLKAASILASRLNEDPPKWASNDVDNGAASWKSSQGTAEASVKERRVKQEHHGNVTKDTIAPESSAAELNVKQEEASRNPLPDGTIPPSNSDLQRHMEGGNGFSRAQGDIQSSIAEVQEFKPAPWANSSMPYGGTLSSTERRQAQRQSEFQIPSKAADSLDDISDPLEEGHDEDSFYKISKHVSPELSSLPRVKIPKHISDAQEGDKHISEGSINSDSFYNNVKKSQQNPSIQAVPEQETPEDINMDIFYSPRVAKLLGGRTHNEKKSEKEMIKAQGTPIDHTGLADGKDQDTFNVRQSSQKDTTIPPIQLSQADTKSPGSSDITQEDIQELTQAVDDASSQVFVSS